MCLPDVVMAINVVPTPCQVVRRWSAFGHFSVTNGRRWSAEGESHAVSFTVVLWSLPTRRSHHLSVAAGAVGATRPQTPGGPRLPGRPCRGGGHQGRVVRGGVARDRGE